MDTFEKMFMTCIFVCIVIGFVVGYLFPNNIVAYAVTAIPAGLVVKAIMKRMLKEEENEIRKF